MSTVPRAPTRRSYRSRPALSFARRRPTRSQRARSTGRRTSRLLAFGVWRRRLVARLPVGTILAVAAAALAVASLRVHPLDAGLDPSAVAPVVVAIDQLDVGTIVELDDIELRTLPVFAVAPAAATDADGVVGRQVTAPIFEGEPLLDARLAPHGLVGVAAATPPGWSAFALPTDAGLPPAEVGQRVDLFALGTTTSLATAADDAERVATDGRVVAVDDLRVTVAVGPDDARAVAAALAGATVVMAVAGPPPAPEPDR